MPPITQQLNAKVKDDGKKMDELITHAEKLVNEERDKSLSEYKAEVDRLNELSLRNSVKINRMQSAIFTLLEQVENRFDQKGDFYCVEDALEYLDIATFAHNGLGRHSGRIVHVQEWIDNQTASAG